MPNLNTPYAILAFPSLFQARPKFEGSETVAFQATLIFPPASQKTDAYKALEKAVQDKIVEGFGNAVKSNQIMMPFKDAGEKAGQWNGFEPGHTYIKTWSTSKPGIVDARREDILLPEEVWAGQLVRANVSPGFWNNSGKRGVTFYLNHVQIIRTDLPRIDGKSTAQRAFDDDVVNEAEAAEADLF